MSEEEFIDFFFGYQFMGGRMPKAGFYSIFGEITNDLYPETK